MRTDVFNTITTAIVDAKKTGNDFTVLIPMVVEREPRRLSIKESTYFYSWGCFTVLDSETLK